MDGKNYKRRNYFIDKKFQSRFIVKFCVVVLLSSLLIGGLVFYFAQDSTTVTIENTKVQVKSTADFILPIMINIIVLVGLFSALVVAVLTLFISHRISGPLYRINKEVTALKNGDLTANFNVRSNDQLQNLAKNLNEMCIVLKNKQLAIKGSFRALSDYLEEKKASLTENERKEIETHLAEVKDNLKFFKSE